MVVALLLLSWTTAQETSGEWPIRDTGFGDTTVQWDHYSLLYKGQRLFSFGGEFHPWRIPVPEMWEDILEKIKASGMNTVSWYTHWGFHAATNTTLRFDSGSGAHDLEKLMSLTRKHGLFVHIRPGPYINSECSAGGMALWATTGAYGSTRNNDTRFTKAWKPYLDAVDSIIAPYQVTRPDGNLLLYQIENEFPRQWSDVANKRPNPIPISYMETLEKNARDNGIIIPFTHNMPSMNGKSWSQDYDTVGAGGNVDLYGLDNYPLCWSCMADCGNSNPSFTLLNYTRHFNEVSFGQPSMMPEYQAGALNPWDGPAEGCEAKTDDKFVNFYYRDNISQRVTILGLYMMYGGTSWGWLATPFVPTSYGYSAAIAENRTIGDKYNEIKLLALMTRVSKDLLRTDHIGIGTQYTENAAITTTELHNAETGARFYTVRHTEPTSNTNETFRLAVTTTSIGKVIIPTRREHLRLDGHVMKILPTDYHFWNRTMIYTTAEVLSYSVFNNKPTIALWVPDEEDGEFMLKGIQGGSLASGDESDVAFERSEQGIVVSFGRHSGLRIFKFDDGTTVLLMDRTTAYRFWVPAINDDPTVPVDQTAMVLGPHLVRGAGLTDGGTIVLRGDADAATTTVEVFAAARVYGIVWNGKRLETTRTSYGSLKARLFPSQAPVSFTAPRFSTWRHKDALPERFLEYDDDGPAWVAANHMTTPSRFTTATKPYLYQDQYGFHNGITLWRGYFDGTATGAYVKVQGGLVHGWSAYVNGHFVGSWRGSLDSATGELTLDFPDGSLNDDSANVLLIVHDNSGHDQLQAALNVRGVLNATLLGNTDGSFTHWRLAGTAGGANGTFLDPTRAQHYNEGGSTAERLGWHLPGFREEQGDDDDTGWATGSPRDGFHGPGMRFYRTNLVLNTPRGHDISLSLRLLPQDESGEHDFRSLLYVNGYQYGRFNPRINPAMNTFPVPPGIWNYNGDNTIGLLLWSQGEEGAFLDIEVVVNYVLASSLDTKFDSAHLRPGWDSRRVSYT